MYSKVIAAEGGEYHYDKHHSTKYRRHVFSYRNTAKYRRGIHRMAAGKGIPRRSGHGIAVWNDACVPDPGTVGAGRHLQKTVHQPVSAPAHHQIGTEILTDTPVDDSHYDKRRGYLTKESHLCHKVCQTRTNTVSEVLQSQKNRYVHC